MTVDVLKAAPGEKEILRFAQDDKVGVLRMMKAGE